MVVVGPFWPYAQDDPQINEMNEAVAAAASAAGVAFINPLGEGWFADTTDLIQEDGLHPNSAGHKVLADRLTADLQALGIS